MGIEDILKQSKPRSEITGKRLLEIEFEQIVRIEVKKYIAEIQTLVTIFGYVILNTTIREFYFIANHRSELEYLLQILRNIIICHTN